jgi:Ca-activated chloride channel family protein
MSWDKNPYVILGLASDATTEDVRAAYRRISSWLSAEGNQSAATVRQLEDLNTAFEILSDSLRRRTYDERNRMDAADTEPAFQLKIVPSKQHVGQLAEPQVVYLLTDIYPEARVAPTEQNANLNLTLVLDRSNSMNGTRMEKVKIASHQIIENMGPQDVISVISFADRAETIIPATYVNDRPALKARISMISPAGGTEIYQGLNAGVKQNMTFLGPRMVNHIILLTDGHTFGDQDQCLDLAKSAAKQGIGISAMGLGNDWNDEFLDELASKTGGNTMYINSASAVVHFLNDHVRSLENIFADRMYLAVAPASNVEIESAFKLSPHPQPLQVEDGIIPLGALQYHRPISVLLQFQLPGNMNEGYQYIARLDVTGDIISNRSQSFQDIADFSVEVRTELVHEDPPAVILDALSKLTLYHLQERAQSALATGNIEQATQRLQNLATRLLAMGQDDLATQALSEARRVAHTSALSDKGKKALKYQTRYLLLDQDEDNQNV